MCHSLLQLSSCYVDHISQQWTSSIMPFLHNRIFIAILLQQTGILNNQILNAQIPLCYVHYHLFPFNLVVSLPDENLLNLLSFFPTCLAVEKNFSIYKLEGHPKLILWESTYLPGYILTLPPCQLPFLLSKISLHTSNSLFLAPKGIPRYLLGREASWLQVVDKALYVIILINWEQATFCQFTCKHDIPSNMVSIAL